MLTLHETTGSEGHVALSFHPIQNAGPSELGSGAIPPDLGRRIWPRTWDWMQLVQSGHGAREGRQVEGQAMVLRRQVTRRFGEATAGELSDLLDELTRPEDVDKVTDALFECTTGDDFIERVRIG